MNKMIKWLGNYWLTGIALIMFAISICINFTKIEDSNSGLIFGFVGILATFIVVGNYAQVMTIKKDSDDKILVLENLIKDLNNSQITSDKKRESFEEKAKNNMLRTEGMLFHNTGLNAILNNKDYQTGIKYYLSAAKKFTQCGNTTNAEIALNNIYNILGKPRLDKESITLLLNKDKVDLRLSLNNLKDDDKNNKLTMLISKIISRVDDIMNA